MSEVVGDAPEKPDELLPSSPILPGWARLGIVLGSSAALWGLIILCILCVRR